MAEAKKNAAKIVRCKVDSDKVINDDGHETARRGVPTAEDKAAVAAAAAVAPPKTGCCTVPAAPPSELKYGDRLRLWVR